MRQTLIFAIPYMVFEGFSNFEIIASKMLSDSLLSLQNTPRCLQMSPKRVPRSSQESPETSQEVPKTLPRRPKSLPRRSLDTLGRSWDALWRFLERFFLNLWLSWVSGALSDKKTADLVSFSGRFYMISHVPDLDFCNTLHGF